MDRVAIAAKVKSMAARMLPGWSYELVFAASPADIGGALGMIEPLPERKKFKLWIAEHPPGEDYDETIAHEMTHGVLSPLTHLLPPTGSVVMIEEMIVEPLGIELAKLMKAVPQYARAVLRALHNPRTNVPALRKRISALAIGRRSDTRKRMDPKALAALAMEGGQFAAMEGLDPAVAEWIKKAIEAMAGGGAEPASDPMRQDPEEGKDAPQMREGDMPPEAQRQYRAMKRLVATQLESTIRMRVHEARTVDGLSVTPAMEAKLRKCSSIESFDEMFEMMKLAMGDGSNKRARSGAEVPDVSGANSAPSLQSLITDGIPEQMARHVVASFELGRDHGEAALDTARKYRKQVPNG